MKNRYLIGGALAIILLVGIAANAAIDAPPVNQNMGLPDTLVENVATETCKGCHPGAPDIHHFMLAKGTTELGCMDCHVMEGPVGSQVMYIERNCVNCHNGSAWYKNPAVNLAIIRPPGTPHHNTTKNSSSSTFQAAYWAADRQCNNCHGSSIVANYDDGHYVPSYDTSMVTPYADYKINSTVGLGQVYGGCLACHDAGTEGPLAIYNNHDTHHGELSGMLGYQCNYCHVGDPSRPRAEPVPDWSSDPNAYYLRIDFGVAYPQYVEMFGWDTAHMHSELRNSTLLNAGDTINGTGCQKCHGVDTLHNIQFDAANTIPNKIPGMGHIGNNSDCNGCHAGWVVATDNPFAGATSIELDGIAPGKLTAGEGTEVTITGSNFVQDGFTTSVLVDGASAQLVSITDTTLVVAVQLAEGTHSIQVEKGSVTSELSTLTVVESVDVVSAELSGDTITIAGTGFGPKPLSDLGVFITTTTGRGKNKVTTTVQADIVSWTGVEIVATADVSAGNPLTLRALNGEDTVTISG